MKLREEWISDPDSVAALERCKRLHDLQARSTTICFVVWVLVSSFSSDASWFQRAGSLGVALAVFALVFTKRSFDAWEELGARDGSYEAISRDLVIAKKLWPEKNLPPISHMGATFEYLFRPLERPLYSQPKGRVLHSRFLFQIEVIWLVVATLQWGYGDLFYCLIYGNGWSTCS